MAEGDPAVRLRQAVLVAAELEPLVATLRRELGLAEPFRDPGVAQFGLDNAVFPIGDCFLEIVSPTAPGTAAGRQLERAGGDGGYMVLFDLEDLEGARARAERDGVRTVWRIDLPDISGTHMHPADLRGAIVSLDGSRPYGSWRWGGPEWTAQIAPPVPGALRGITVAAGDPVAVARRWGDVLGIAPTGSDATVLEMSDGADVSFVASGTRGVEEITEIGLALPAELRAGRDSLAVGAARLTLSDI